MICEYRSGHFIASLLHSFCFFLSSATTCSKVQDRLVRLVRLSFGQKMADSLRRLWPVNVDKTNKYPMGKKEKHLTLKVPLKGDNM